MGNDNLPLCTGLGSSNYGMRSMELDLETDLVVVPQTQSFKHSLKKVM